MVIAVVRVFVRHMLCLGLHGHFFVVLVRVVLVSRLGSAWFYQWLFQFKHSLSLASCFCRRHCVFWFSCVSVATYCLDVVGWVVAVLVVAFVIADVGVNAFLVDICVGSDPLRYFTWSGSHRCYSFG